MNKKKAAIESLAAQEPASKVIRKDYDEGLNLDLGTDVHASSMGATPDPGNSTHSHRASDTDDVPEIIESSHSQLQTPNLQRLVQPSTDNSAQTRASGFSPAAVAQSSSDSIWTLMNVLNCCLFQEKNKDALHRSFCQNTDYFDDASGLKLSCSPFRHCVIPNFITDEELVKDMEASLKELPLTEKSSDLYKFNQSKELNESKSAPLVRFRSFCDVVKDFLVAVTDIPLNSKIDLFCSHYSYTDVLLCHDDELEERRIAFIYYLVPDLWSATDGGTLDLFDTDELGNPKSIVKSVVPKRNSFVCFEVSAKSFHQVSEILCRDKTRMSLSGWFHGPPLSRPPPYLDAVPPALPCGSIEENVFYSWFNPMYLAPEVQMDIRKRFQEDSEIDLTYFLEEDLYKSLKVALNEGNISWNLLGPANKRNYYALDSKESVPSIVLELLKVIHSDAFFLVLSNLTGLKLHPLAPPGDDDESDLVANGESSSNGAVSNPRVRSEVRKWEHGCYTLAHDTDSDIVDFALDVALYITSDEEWPFENGGYTSYIAKGEEEELLSVGPAGNSLALVYRDKGTMRFVKHLNHRVTSRSMPRFFEVSAVYYE